MAGAEARGATRAPAPPGPPRFHPGQRVRVLDLPVRGHVRTPRYIRGKVGRVAAVHGAYRNPEALAYGGAGLPKQPLYLVVFAQRDVWGPGYVGPAGDTLGIDLYEHWLEPA